MGFRSVIVLPGRRYLRLVIILRDHLPDDVTHKVLEAWLY
ncbi:Uncharacterised protein [Citrobacter freundii]|jgi:hypothetical protein|nr:Uncharacterised protein [Citrobacter freundii]